MATRTPWRSYLTDRPQPFLVGLSGSSAFAAVGQLGNGGAFCEGTPMGMMVVMKTQKGPGGLRRVPTYTVNLSPWTQNVMPEVCLHPLALPHLFVTEQIARGDIMGLLGAEDTVVKNQTTLVDRPPADTSMLHGYLGAMLGRRRFRVTLQTNFDMEVRAARS